MRFFNINNLTDVIIRARGGGAYEDLDGFNSEELAREVYKSKIPVVSAIGHEVDYTILDFAADIRAQTPSAAAELAAPDKDSLLNLIGNLKYMCIRKINVKLKDEYIKLKELNNRIDFKNNLNYKMMRIENLYTTASVSMKHIIDKEYINLESIINSIKALNQMEIMSRCV